MITSSTGATGTSGASSAGNVTSVNASTTSAASGAGTTGTVAHRDLALTGRVDATAVLALRIPVTAAVIDGPAVVLLDVAGVTSATASGVAGLLELLRLARMRGGDLRLHGTSQAIADAQVAARLTAITRVYASRAEAVDAGVRRPADEARPHRRHRRPHAARPVAASRLANQLHDHLTPMLGVLEGGTEVYGKNGSGSR